MGKQWWKESVIYQIYPRSFKDSNGDGIGDLRGIIEKLDYLEFLGIDAIWLCPIFASPNVDNGYDISNYKEIMEEFGTMNDFDELLEEAHRRGIKIILDLVMNHTSDEHPWFQESRSSRENPKRDWYIWRDGKDGQEPNNWKSIFEGSVWEFDEKTGQYYFHTFSKNQPDLNWENPEVRKALEEMVTWWIRKGIDGFRIDAISHIKKEPGFPDMPNPHGLDYVPADPYMTNVDGIEELLNEFSRNTFKKYGVMTVGEASGVTAEEAEKWVNEKTGFFNMIFHFDHTGLWKKSSDDGVDVVALKKALSRWQYALEGKGWNALFLENHDQVRSVSRWGDEGRFWKESAKMLGAFYFFMKGTPYIYQGQEIGMTNVQFPDIDDYDDIGMKNFYHSERKKGRSHEEIMEVIWMRGRDNSRTPMQWDDGPMAGFTSGTTPWLGINPNYPMINVARQIKDPDSILHFYRKMIQLRKQEPCFVYGTYRLHLPDDPHFIVYTRSLGGKKALVLCNFHHEEKEFTMPKELLQEKFIPVLGNYPLSRKPLSYKMKVHPYQVIVALNK